MSEVATAGGGQVFAAGDSRHAAAGGAAMSIRHGGVLTTRWSNAEPRGMAVGAGFGHLGFWPDLTAMADGAARLPGEPEQLPVAAALGCQEFEARVRDAVLNVRDTRRLCAILALGIGPFTELVDVYGLDGGNTILRAVVERLRDVTREGDIVGQLYGNEFAVLLPRLRTVEEALDCAARINTVLGRPFLLSGRPVPVSAAIGVAFCPNDARSEGDLVRRAVLAMHRARHGEARILRFNPSMDRVSQERQDLEEDFADALANGSFALHWQPIVSCRAGELLGFEALIRWNRLGYGKVSPAVFVPLAERLGMFHPFDTWVLNTACREAAQWPSPLRVAVNICAGWFQTGDLASVVKASLESSGLPAHRLEIEVTERVFLESGRHAVDQLTRLKALGVHLSLDDFGTYYSSLSYLRTISFDKIKLDRSFVEGLGTSRRTEVIVRAVLQLGAGLDMRVCAEGVSQDGQLSILQAYGCDEAQGFLIGRPGLLTDTLFTSYRRLNRNVMFDCAVPAGRPRPHDA